MFVPTLVTLLLSTAATMHGAAQDEGRAKSTAPQFVKAPCPFKADPKVIEHIPCGYVTVPENRAKPGSRRLKLAVAILKSSRANPRPDPVVVLAGGPGEAFVTRAPSLIADGSMDILRADRDVILYDQRGVGFSEPEFCPDLANEWTGMFDNPAQRRAHQGQIAARCGDSMRRAGYDLAQYNSVVSAHDLQDLRRALGYREWNLHGRSYGSRLALIAMRVAPEGIRSVVLDGPLPPNRAKWFNMPGDYTDVLKRISAACASQPDCNAAFPDVEGTFWRTVEALQRESFTRQVIRADGAPRTVTPSRFAGVVHAALERLQPVVPMLVHAMHARDESRITAIGGALTSQFVGRRVTGGDQGLAQTVNCYEEAPLNTTELQRRMRNAYASVLTGEAVFPGPEGCDALHPYRAAPEQLLPVKSDIPTLIVTGEFDLQTHRSNGPLVAASLKNSQLVEIPNVAHVQSFRHDCTRTIMRDFHNAPMKKVDLSCLTEIPPLRFATDVKAILK